MDFANADREKNEQIFEGIKDTPRIPELDWQNTQSFEEVPMKERLYPLIDQSDVIVVAGAYFGDEGKGKTVDDVCHHPGIKYIVRVNSGENAGHTVFHDGKKFVFHLAPSGILSEDKINLIGPECVMDPISFLQAELQPLLDSGKDYSQRLFVGNVHIVTPYHKLIDLVSTPANASTLKGMSPVHASKVTKRGIRLDHIFNNRQTAADRLKKDMESYIALLKARNITEEELLQTCQGLNQEFTRIPPHVIGFLTATDKVEYLLQLYETHVIKNPHFPRRKDVTHEIRVALEKGQKVLLEGPQSFWLSNASEKFWESSTSADTAAPGILAAARINLVRHRALILNIHKTPASSRVGIGANPAAYVRQDYFSAHNVTSLKSFPPGACTDFDGIQKRFFEAVQPNGTIKPLTWEENGIEYGVGVAMAAASSIRHGEFGATTRKPRVCGLFDCVAHNEVNRVQGPHLSISAVDRGDDYDKIGLVIAYVFFHPEGQQFDSNGRVFRNGDIIKAGDQLPTEACLHYCHPIVAQIDGWRGQPIAAGKRKPGDPLPKGVQNLLGAIEHFTGATVISIGNGPNQTDFIYVRRT
eukprot:TRINITY_DN2528_c0_g1_i1.p1 TRINITY_DN2528_c0_g1~~TRINITY_DN2528_c0_g1_i1.p1  ORF type:complete len:591 (-),score=97.20 TRINITY_DN2528_c0_g1_i1:100-1851(-)